MSKGKWFVDRDRDGDGTPNRHDRDDDRTWRR
jgi:hypothetical protein